MGPQNFVPLEKEFGKKTDGSKGKLSVYLKREEREMVWRKHRHRQAGQRGGEGEKKETERTGEEERQHMLWRSFKSPVWIRSFHAASGQSCCFIWL